MNREDAAAEESAAAEMGTPMEPERTRQALVRVAAHAGGELRTKKPHWGDSILCDGLLYAARTLEIETPALDAAAWMEPNLAAGPRTGGWIWSWAAEALPALDLYLYNRDERFLSHARAVVAALHSKAAHTSDGAIVPHPPAQEVWVDITYFSAPAMARLARLDGNPALAERALDQLLVHLKHLLDDATGMVWHVAYLSKGEHSPCLWARGNSWFSIAATEVLAEIRAARLEGRFASKLRVLSEALARQLNAVAACQDAGGLWHTVIDRPDSYLEASGAAGFTLALGRTLAAPIAGLDLKRAREAYRLGLEAVCAKIGPDGEFTGVSAQTPPGDFAFYQSIALGSAPYAAGILMMALAEALGA